MISSTSNPSYPPILMTPRDFMKHGCMKDELKGSCPQPWQVPHEVGGSLPQDVSSWGQFNTESSGFRVPKQVFEVFAGGWGSPPGLTAVRAEAPRPASHLQEEGFIGAGGVFHLCQHF